MIDRELHPQFNIRVIQRSDLVDQGDLARLLGLKLPSLRAMRSASQRYRQLDGLPAPFGEVNYGPVWRRSEIEAWIESRPAPRENLTGS